jgi:ATP/maltotriose-dependent transcriptional regulator MalT
MAMKAFSLQFSNKGREADDLFERHQAQIPTDYRLGFMRSHIFHPLVRIYQADLNPIIRSAKLVYRISKEEQAWVSHVMASYLLGTIYYIQNDLDKVETYIKSVADHRLGGRPNWVSHTLFFGVLNYMATGQNEKLQTATNQVTSYLKSFKLANFDDLAYSFEVELAIQNNNLKLAEELATKTRFESIPIVFSFYFTQLTKIKLLLFKGDYQSLEDAFDMLTEYEKHGRSTYNLNFLIQVYALLALWYQQKGKKDDAVGYLRKSLAIGRVGSYIRTYVDLGKNMYTLFGHLSSLERAESYIVKILYAFDQQKVVHESRIPEKKGVRHSLQTGGELNQKEIEILKWVSRGYQNKEIADKLCVSVETVKKYLYYTYNKLGVKNRTSAVSRAVHLNLISTVSEQS